MSGTSFFYPDAPHRMSSTIALRFATGARACGHEWFTREYKGEIDDLNTTYGILHGGTDVIRHCEREKKDYWYIDHGYFRREEYCRVVKNELQHTSFAGVGGAPAVSECGENRLRELGITLAPRRDPATGEIIVLVPPTDYQWRFYTPSVDSPENWVKAWQAHCEKTYCKPVVISRKGDKLPLTKLLDRASYVVGFNSTGLLEAAARGIFVESTGPSPLFWLKPWHDRKTWEDTRYAIFCSLAERQFSLGELASGLAQTVLRNVGEFPG